MEPSAEQLRSQRLGYLAAAGAMLCWSTTALTTKWTVDLWTAPAFLFWHYLFAAAAGLAVELIRRRGRLASMFRVSWKVYAVGFGGVFTYGFLYAEAFDLASRALEVSLINYLWPLMVIVFAVVLLRERPGWRLYAGAGVCVGGLGLLFAGRGVSFPPHLLWAYLMAFGCAVVWGAFSALLPKVCGKLGGGATSHSNLFILLALAGSAVNYALRGPWPWPSGAQLAGAAYVGVVTTTVALALWEVAMRRGRAAVVGLISHVTPLSSTAFLWILKGHNEPFTFWSLAGAVCITAGAMLPLLRRRRPPAEPIV